MPLLISEVFRCIFYRQTLFGHGSVGDFHLLFSDGVDSSPGELRRENAKPYILGGFGLPLEMTCSCHGKLQFGLLNRQYCSPRDIA